MSIRATKAEIEEKKRLAEERIRSFHIRPIGNSPGPVFLISTAYPGVWMEHAFDALCYAHLKGGEEAVLALRGKINSLIRKHAAKA